MNKEESYMLRVKNTDDFRNNDLDVTSNLNCERDIFLEAVLRNGLSLAHASEHIKNDKLVVLAAIRQNPHSLEHASDNLKNEKEIVLAAVGQKEIL